MTTINVPDSVKMLRETLCVAQSRIGNSGLDEDRGAEHIARLGRIIDELDRMRPLGPDGKHGHLHTAECGCEVEVALVGQFQLSAVMTAGPDLQITCRRCRRWAFHIDRPMLIEEVIVLTQGHRERCTGE